MALNVAGKIAITDRRIGRNSLRVEVGRVVMHR